MTTLPPSDPVGLARQQILAQPVPWDELRDRRVLGRIEARLDAVAEGTAAPTMPMPAQRRRGRVIAIAAAGLAVAAAVLLAVFAVPWSSQTAEDPSAMSLASADDVGVRPEAEPSIPLEAPAEMALADGSVAQLLVAAKVDVLVQEDDRVLLDQREGSVRYEVARNPGRRFVVEAAGVEVRVIGTIFTVTIADDAHVEVSVERGLVEVVAGDRVAELGKGDSLRVPAQTDDSMEDVLIVDDDEPLVGDTDDAGQVAVATQLRARTPRRPTSSGADAPSIESLLGQADAARATGDLGRAASALGTLVKAHPRDPRAYSAWFQLGKVQRNRGKHAAAARAFESCWKRSPRGALAEDARAEAAASWQDSGRPERAAKAAQGYLERYPSGTHAARMAKIASSAG